MDNVIPFPQKPEEPEALDPHGLGEAFCLSCKHVWQAVAPVGPEFFECPACHRFLGRWKFMFCPPDSDPGIWECRCGNQLFYITLKGTFCPSCGIYQQLD